MTAILAAAQVSVHPRMDRRRGGAVIMNDRPARGTSSALYWVLGYMAAAKGEHVCPFRMDLQSGVQWVAGNSAYREGKR